MTEEPAKILDFSSVARATRREGLVSERISPQPERPHFGKLYGEVNGAYRDFRNQTPEQNYSPEDDGPSAA